MRRAPKLASLGGALLLIVCATSANAAPTAQERERARALMDQGDARIEAKAYEAALEAYRGADQIMGVPTTALEVARTLEKLGRFVEAQDALLKVIDFPRRVDEPKPFAEARQQAQRILGLLLPRIPRVTIKVDGLPTGIEPRVSWDRRALSNQQLGTPLLADAGSHELSGSADGFLPVVRSVTLTEAQKLEVVLAFARADQATSPPPPTGPARGPAPLEPERRPSRALMWGSFGLAAVAVGAGTFSGIKSLSLTSDAKKHCSGSRCSDEAEPRIAEAKTWANVSNVAFGVGVVAAGVGVWRFVADRQRPAQSDERSATIEAGIGLGEAWLGGSF